MTKEERKEYNKLYYINNKETIIKQTQQYYTNLQPLFKTTEIAKSLGYINEMGNRNKSDN